MVDLTETEKRALHLQRHMELHRALDELVADYVRHTRRSLSGSTVMDLLLWSARQTDDPTPTE
jgi:hypothetical protein